MLMEFHSGHRIGCLVLDISPFCDSDATALVPGTCTCRGVNVFHEKIRRQSYVDMMYVSVINVWTVI